MVKVHFFIRTVAVLSIVLSQVLSQPVKPPGDYAVSARSDPARNIGEPIVPFASDQQRLQLAYSGKGQDVQSFRVKLQAKIDATTGRQKQADAKLKRRNDDADGSSSGENFGNSVFAANTSPSPSRTTRSREFTMQSFDLQPQDPEFEPLINYLSRNEHLFEPGAVPREAAERLRELHGPYRYLYPERGYQMRDGKLAPENSQLIPDLLQSTDGNFRISQMGEMIQYVFDHARAFHLDTARVAFLSALRRRLKGLEVILSPTPTKIQALSNEADSSTSLLSTLERQLDSISLKNQLIQQRYWQLRMHARRVSTDIHLLFRMEAEFDALVERLGWSPHPLVRRSNQKEEKPQYGTQLSSTGDDRSDHLNGMSTAHGQEMKEDKPGASRLVDLQPRSGESGSGQQSIWQDPPLEETLDEMGIGAEEIGAEAIGRFHQLREPLFPTVTRSSEALQQLQSVYRTYQLAHPVRGRAVDITYRHIFHAVTMEAVGRDRFRDIDAVLSHLIENAAPLRLDSVRVGYLEVLRERFRLSARLLTPTLDKIVTRGAHRLLAQFLARSPAQDARTENERIQQFLRVRTQLAKNNEQRLDADASILSHLEENLDHMIRGIGGGMITGRPLARRDTSTTELTDAKPHRVQRSDSTHPQHNSRRDDILHLLERRRIVPALSQATPRTPSQLVPLAPTGGQTVGHEMHQAYLDRISIAQFRRGEQALLPASWEASEQRERLIRLLRGYQNAAPAQGQISSVRLMMEDVGRKRFEQMEPILSYLVANREALHLDRQQVGLLEALIARFRESRQLKSPTLEDIKKGEEGALNRKTHGALSEEGYRLYLKKAMQLRAFMSNHAWTQGARILEDLDLIKRIEGELAGISRHIRQTAEGATHLVRRDATIPEAHEDQAGHSKVKRRLRFFRTADERQPSDAEVRDIISPLGMHLADPYARPIAAYRLSEGSLLDGRQFSSQLNMELVARWMDYREKFPQRMPFYSGGLLMQAGLYPFLDTDQGARFGQARDMIKFLLDNKHGFRLSTKEIHYLDALQHRFEMADALMRPLPSALSLVVKANHPHANPVYQQLIIRNWLAERKARIQMRAHSIGIDTKLLHTLESELDYLHGIP